MNEMEKRCPICDRPATQAYQPFCSKRCADVDLHRWLSGKYVVSSTGEHDDDDTPRPPLKDEEN